MSALPSIIYKTFTKRFSTILLGATGTVFVFDLVFNKATDAYWEKRNQGKLWKDVEPLVLARIAAEE